MQKDYLEAVLGRVATRLPPEAPSARSERRQINMEVGVLVWCAPIVTVFASPLLSETYAKALPTGHSGTDGRTVPT